MSKRVKNIWTRILVGILTATMLIGQIPTAVFAEELSAPQVMTTEAPTTEDPTTEDPITEAPTTEDPITEDITTEGQGTVEGINDPADEIPEEQQHETIGNANPEERAEENTSEGTNSGDTNSGDTVSENGSAVQTEQGIQQEAVVQEQREENDIDSNGQNSVGIVSTTDSLTLADAKDYLSLEENELIITNAEGLILLSNTNSSIYQNYKLKLKQTGSNTDLYDLTKTVTLGDSTYTFQGLGNIDYPFNGTLSYADGSYRNIITTVPLFQAISPTAVIEQGVTFYLLKETDKTSDTELPLLATLVKRIDTTGDENNSSVVSPSENIWNINLTANQDNDHINDVHQIGGLIGTIDTGSSVSLNMTTSANVNCKNTSADTIGLLCHAMKSGSYLTAAVNTNGSSISITASAQNANAGGLVGSCNMNTSLTFSGTFAATVTSENGNAGGLVGVMTDTTLTVVDSARLQVTVEAGEGKYAGGIAATYNNTLNAQLNVAGFAHYSVTLTASAGAGGLFGLVDNSNVLAIEGTDEHAPIISSSINSEKIGGLIAVYRAKALTNTLQISHVVSSVTRTGGNTLFGGVIGIIPQKNKDNNDNTCYVKLVNQSVKVSGLLSDNDKKFGGMIANVEGAVMLDISGNSSLSGVGETEIINITKNKRGGIVGFLQTGVIRLDGTTTFSNITFTPYKDCGNIVGENRDGLVYACAGWSLTAESQVSNIGNWSEVIRLDGEHLKEGEEENSLFTFNSTDHTVTVNHKKAESEGNYLLNNKAEFAAYALAFNYDENAVLKIANTDVNPTQTQKVKLGTDIDLKGTGILGIGRDNGYYGIDNKGEYPGFQGTFDGQNNSITLDIGNQAGVIYAYQLGSANNLHGRLGLFASVCSASNAVTSIKNLTVKGVVNMSVPGGSSGNNKNEHPLRVAGVVAYQTGEVEYTNVISEIQSTVSGDNNPNNDSAYVAQAGFVAHCAKNSKITFSNGEWKGDQQNNTVLENSRTNNENYIGGLIGYADTLTLNIDTCKLSGRINHTATDITNNSRLYSHVGGVVADLSNSTVNICSLTVNNESITTKKSYSGGLLGYSWRATNVTLGGTKTNEEGTTTASTGVTISGSKLYAQGRFGGLVYQATGYWNATARASIRFEGDTNTFKGKSDKNTPSGLLVGTGLDGTNALYLEVGTFGNDSENNAYQISNDNVQVYLNDSESPANAEYYFDELVGMAINDSRGSNNAVVSLAVRGNDGGTAWIDNSECNTYIGQIGNFKNTKTRYYYNLDNYRQPDSQNSGKSSLSARNGLNTPAQVLSWSVAQFAASNIRDYFCKDSGNAVTITGDADQNLDLTGYSYYPVTPRAKVTLGDANVKQEANVKFDYNNIQTSENGNKQPSDTEHQHYLMNYGLFYDVKQDLTVNNVGFAGTVGNRQENSSADIDDYGSGALICGTLSGSVAENRIVAVKLNNVTLKGISVSGVERPGANTEGSENDSTNYAPLLINRINQAVSLNVDNVTVGEGGYTSGAVAATSLIGKVGNENATKLNLVFSNIALDSRVNAGSTTSVQNNGDTPVNYYTTQSIFTNATLLESFQYSSGSSGKYNFNSYDDKVTYGVEISNTSTGRNIRKQYFYYDTTTYVWDGVGTPISSDDTISGYYNTGTYLRYVHVAEGSGYQELDINIRSLHLDQGCGTYGDPYQITEGAQLVVLANFLSNGSATDWVVCLNKDVYAASAQSSNSYHVNGEDNGKDEYYWCATDGWYPTSKNGSEYTKGGSKTDISTDQVRAYLRNAYYQIQDDITISDPNFAGIGGKDVTKDTFSGVIVGKKQTNETFPTVSIHIKNDNAFSTFGGLIQYSQGSVIKDLTIDYTDSEISMKDGVVYTYDTNVENLRFFGGVVGYCMGGDTIIDNVSVKYAENSIKLKGSATDRLIAMGGYVGLVGGAKSVTANDDYEKTGGGVVFRNMGNHENTFGVALIQAKQDAAGFSWDQEGTLSKITVNTGTLDNYFFCNPYVGRVLDGYACYDNPEGSQGDSTLNNTDKNYTIPDLAQGNRDLIVAKDFTVTVNSAQGLWLLSAIVNSGAGAMDINGSYQDHDNGKYIEAYRMGKPRSGDYSYIGLSSKEVYLVDEVFWGGVEKQSADRVSFLVKNYTNKVDSVYYAAQISGRSNIKDTKSNNNYVKLFFLSDIDMKPYGNGFRGIGGSYGQKKSGTTAEPDLIKRRSLFVSGVSGKEGGSTITLSMNQHDYETEYESKIWSNQGAGLFTVFIYKSSSANSPCVVENLTISGTVSVRTYNNDGNECGIKKAGFDLGIGGFASRTAKSQNQYLKFTEFHLEDLQVVGGTATGGTIGLVECCGEISFDKWSIKNTKVFKWVNNDGSTGGLTGWFHSGKKMTINGYRSSNDTMDKLNIANLSVVIRADKKEYGNIGGLTGANDDSELLIQNLNVKDLTVMGQRAREIGGFADGGNRAITISNCVLTNLTVKDNPDGNNNYDAGTVGGLIGYFKDREANITQVTIQGNSSIISQKNSAGGMVGESNNKLNITNCQIIGTDENPVRVFCLADNSAGGLVGNNNNTSNILGCSLTRIDIFSKTNYSGGLLGRISNGIINVSNVSFLNVNVASGNKDKNTGLISSYNNNKIINGYNILAKDCRVGYNADLKSSLKITDSVELIVGNQTGLWLGKYSGSEESRLVAVSVAGIKKSIKDVGNNSGSIMITYADYLGDQSSQTEGSKAPYVDINPVGSIQIQRANSSPITLTGNAVATVTKDSTNEQGEAVSTTESLAALILENCKLDKTDISRIYWNLPDYSDEFTKTETSAVYLSMYGKEEGVNGSETIVDEENRAFPILVINTNEREIVNTQLWKFIAAMTNVSTTTEAQKQVTDIAIGSYKWDATAKCFVDTNTPSLAYFDNGTTKVIRPTGRFDNTKSQITVLDVRYDDPTSTNADEMFHLYIPVLVKKLMTVSANVFILEGTNYYADDYLSQLEKHAKDENVYATVGFQESLTAYIEFNYDRPKQEWSDALDNGENLLWSYQKELNLISQGTPLPQGTQMLLLDRLSGAIYTYMITEADTAEVQRAFPFSKFGLTQESHPICDLLGIKAVKADAGIYVVETDVNKATVRVGQTYYRPAGEEDADKDKYALTIGDVVTHTENSDYLTQAEGFYLTFRVPKNESSESVESVYNNLMIYDKRSFIDTSGIAPPTVVEKSQGTYKNLGGRYFIYPGVTQSNVTIDTTKVRNDNAVDDTVMANGDSILVTLTTVLDLDDECVDNFGNYTPANLTQQFTIDLKKYTQSGSYNRVSISANSVNSHYEIYEINSLSDLTEGDVAPKYKTSDQLYASCQDAERLLFNLDEVVTDSKTVDLPTMILNAKKAGKKLCIKLITELMYDDIEKQGFPMKTSDLDDSGISVAAMSGIANRESLLLVTDNKESVEHNKRYYTASTSQAVLTYDTKLVADETGSGDSNAQLGINASDPERNLLSIKTVARYDYSNVSTEHLEQAKAIRYTLELFQKSNSGVYDETVPLSLTTYWSALTVDGTSVYDSVGNNTSYVLVKENFTPDDSRVCYLPIEFSAITGTEFEEAGLTYSNYKVKLTVVLLDENQQPLQVTEATDYIIYTNARVYQHIF